MHEILIEFRQARYMVLRSLRLLLHMLEQGASPALLVRLLHFVEDFVLTRYFPGEERLLRTWQHRRLRPDVAGALRSLQLEHEHANHLTRQLREVLVDRDRVRRLLAGDGAELVHRMSSALIHADDLLEEIDLNLARLNPSILAELEGELTGAFVIDESSRTELGSLESAVHALHRPGRSIRLG